MQQTHRLFDFSATQPPSVTTKKGFGELLGLTPSRITQLVRAGLPVRPDGRIDVAQGKAWVRENVNEDRRRANLGDDDERPASPRAEKALAEAALATMKAERLAGRLISRDATLRALEARARAQRDGWVGWVNRAAPAIAAETGVDLSAITSVLDRLVREQLETLARETLELPR